MGVFSKREVPPTATNYVEEPVKTASDPEKPEIAEVGTRDQLDVRPDMERRVVQKMDRRVPWLVAALYLVAFLGKLGDAHGSRNIG